MFRFRIFCLVPLLFVGVCQLAGQDSIRVQYRFPSGEVSSEGWLVSGVPEGFWRSYHEDGIRKSEGNRSGGQLEGEWIFYDAKGRVQTTLRYEQGAKQGEEIRWDTTGVKRRIRPWKADVLDGEERVLDDRGILQSSPCSLLFAQRKERRQCGISLYVSGQSVQCPISGGLCAE